MFRKKSKNEKDPVIQKADISIPTNYVHKINVTHDEERQQLVGLPIQWDGLISKNFVADKRRSAYVDPNHITETAPAKVIIGQKSHLTPEQKAAGLTRKISIDRSNSLRMKYEQRFKRYQPNNFESLSEDAEEDQKQKRSSSSSDTSSSGSIYMVHASTVRDQEKQAAEPLNTQTQGSHNDSYSVSGNENASYQVTGDHNESYPNPRNQNGPYPVFRNNNDSFPNASTHNDSYTVSGKRNDSYPNPRNHNDSYSVYGISNDSYSNSRNHQDSYTVSGNNNHSYPNPSNHGDSYPIPAPKKKPPIVAPKPRLVDGKFQSTATATTTRSSQNSERPQIVPNIEMVLPDRLYKPQQPKQETNNTHYREFDTRVSPPYRQNHSTVVSRHRHAQSAVGETAPEPKTLDTTLGASFSVTSMDDEEYMQVSQKALRRAQLSHNRTSIGSVDSLNSFNNVPDNMTNVQSSILRKKNKHMAKSVTELNHTGVTFKPRVKVQTVDVEVKPSNSEEYLPLANSSERNKMRLRFSSQDNLFDSSKEDTSDDFYKKQQNCMEETSHLTDMEFKNFLWSVCSAKDPRHFLKNMKKMEERSTFGVYRADDPTIKQVVAIKRMPIKKHARRELLFNEVLVLREYQHPNIVGFFDSYLVGDELWISLEYMKGGKLTKYITSKKIKLKEDQIIYILQCVLKALVFLHSKGIIHRDIKSDSVLLTEEGIVKLSEFGYCGQISEDYPKRRSFIGTPYWMAPEIASKRPYGTEVDIWSLGILVIEIVEKQPPYFNQSQKEVLKLLANNPPPVLKDSKNASGLLNRFLTHCLQKNVQTRPTAKDLLTHPLLCKHVTSEVIDFISKKN